MPGSRGWPPAVRIPVRGQPGSATDSRTTGPTSASSSPLGSISEASTYQRAKFVGRSDLRELPPEDGARRARTFTEAFLEGSCDLVAPQQSCRRERVAGGILGWLAQRFDPTGVGVDHREPPPVRNLAAGRQQVSFWRYQRNPVEDLAINDRLSWKTAQVVAATLDLVAVEAHSDCRQVYACPALAKSHFGYETAVLTCLAQLRHEQVANSDRIVDQAKRELAWGYRAPVGSRHPRSLRGAGSSVRWARAAIANLWERPGAIWPHA